MPRGSPSPAQGLMAGQSPTLTVPGAAPPRPLTPAGGTPTPSVTLTSTPTPPLGSATPTPTKTAVAAETSAPSGDSPADGDAADGDAAVDWQAFVPTDIADHLATMDRAARDSGCGVPWQLLAAIARVESDFGRNMATSSAGAIGYGQFLPSSWQAFGNDGNVYDYRAALPAIATYLCHSGLASDPRAALFAYNHADWYVDLVLDLAVRYDRMAPGAPTPDVLDLNPAVDAAMPMHYAPGRDLRLQTSARSIDGQGTWLGVPWRGRPPRLAISASTLETTSLAMLRATFGLAGDAPTPAASTQIAARSPQPAETDQSGLVANLAERAWAGGLFANPSPLGDAWSIPEIRQRIEQGQSVVALLNPSLLPGHDPAEAAANGDQPVLVIGITPSGLVYSDPSFSSSLGYGLELSDAEFVTAWQAASTPLQALAISTRPEPPLRDGYFRELPMRSQVVAQAMLTSVPILALPTAAADSTALDTQRQVPGADPGPPGADPQPSDPETRRPLTADPGPPGEDPSASTANAPSALSPRAGAVLTANDDDQQSPGISQAEDGADSSWLILAGAAVYLSGVFALRRWRARPP